MAGKLTGGSAKRRVWNFGDRFWVIEMERKGLGKAEYRACCFLGGRLVGGREFALVNEFGNGIADSERRWGVSFDMYGVVGVMHGTLDVGSDAVDRNEVLADTVMRSPEASVRTEVSEAGRE